MFPHRIKFYKPREPDLATAMYLGKSIVTLHSLVSVVLLNSTLLCLCYMQ